VRKAERAQTRGREEVGLGAIDLVMADPFTMADLVPGMTGRDDPTRPAGVSVRRRIPATIGDGMRLEGAR